MRSVLCFFVFISLTEAGCPRAIFELFNGTVRAAYNFVDSPVGNIGSSETCPYTGRPYLYLPCYPNSTWGYHEPYFSACSKSDQSLKIFTTTYKPNPYVNFDIDEVAKLPMTNTEEINHVYDYLNDQRRSFQSSNEIASVVKILDQMNRVNNPLPIYPIVDKILSKSSIQSLHEAQTTNQSLVKLFSSLEKFSQIYPTQELEQSFTHDHLAVSIVNIPTHRPKPIVGFAFDSKTNQTFPLTLNETRNDSTSIQLNSQALLHQNRLVFSVYDHRHKLFDDSTHHVLTRVLSLTIDQPQYTSHLHSFVKMNFFVKNQFKKKKIKVQCAYWHIYENQTARWSTNGCQLIDYDEHNVQCQCDHLTHFAVLMEVTKEEIPKAVDQILTLMTLIGLSLSSLGLCLTILTFLIFKKLRRHFSQKSLLLLSINLLIVNLIFLVTRLYPWSNSSCILFASILHYFLLATFSWMFIMALIQYLLFVRVFPTTISAFTLKAAAFAQTVPLIPVSAVLLMNPENYERSSDGFCWLTSYPLCIGFILPVSIYIVINSILFALVARALLCHAQFQTNISNSSNRTESQRFSRFILTLSCFVVLGMSWIFGIFTFGPLRIVFQVLFCLCASLTGFFIFVLYIVTSKAKRTCWSNAMKSLAISSIYSPTLSTSSVLTGHKDLSTATITDHLKSSSSSSNGHPKRHLIDGYMPSSPPAPAPPFSSIDHERSHVWSPQTNYIYETYPSSIDDYSFFYASNHDATKL